MEGIINILKPPGMTSHDVVNFLRKLLNIKRIGYSGTLDPLAAGVLPVFIGKATKAIEFFKEDEKEYVAEMVLGISTDSGDLAGRVIDIKRVKVDIEQVIDVFKQFVGKIKQVPPMFSAVHYKGEKLYELARKGIIVEREPRIVEIKSLKLLAFKDQTVRFKVLCSKGTYVRTLCEDIGRRLNCGACLSCLIRTKAGRFCIKDSIPIEIVEESIIKNELSTILIPVDTGLDSFPSVNVFLEKGDYFIKGRVYHTSETTKEMVGRLVRVFGDGKFLGMGKVEIKNKSILVRAVKSLA